MTDREKWDKGELIYNDFKKHFALKFNAPIKTVTPSTYTLELFATLKGKKLLKALLVEYLVAIDILHYEGVLIIK